MDVPPMLLRRGCVWHEQRAGRVMAPAVPGRFEYVSELWLD